MVKPLTRKEWKASLQKMIDEFDWEGAGQARKWVGLTDEEELKLAQDSMGKSRHWLVAQVEAKLKEKNNG